MLTLRQILAIRVVFRGDAACGRRRFFRTADSTMSPQDTKKRRVLGSPINTPPPITRHAIGKKFFFLFSSVSDTGLGGSPHGDFWLWILGDETRAGDAVFEESSWMLRAVI